MQRRKAIRNLIFWGIGGTSMLTGIRCMPSNGTTDIAYLEKNIELLAAISDVIIPTTDTPGAKDAGVDRFIVQIIKDCVDVKTKNHFINGLKALQGYSLDSYSKPFTKCSIQEKEQIIAKFEKMSFFNNSTLRKIRNRLIGKPFFVMLKEYIIEGYCSSELGATQGLSYVMIPGSYKGKIKIEEGQKAWATK